MRDLSNAKLKEKIEQLHKNIISLKELDIDNYYCANLIDWFNELVLKNKSIYKSKRGNGMDQELYKKTRQYIYWINFGKNIGSEFQNYHYAVVLFESKYTAMIVPLTSKKEQDPKWIEENKELIVDLGKVEGYPHESKECYACTFMIHTVSKKRLDRCGDKIKGYFEIKLSNDQMKTICDKISKIAYNTIDKEQ